MMYSRKWFPATYFLRGESAPVQLRNSAGFSVPDGKLVLTAPLGASWSCGRGQTNKKV
jgi:hypothetical protein